MVNSAHNEDLEDQRTALESAAYTLSGVINCMKIAADHLDGSVSKLKSRPRKKVKRQRHRERLDEGAGKFFSFD